jgi:hypothetical protein
MLAVNKTIELERSLKDIWLEPWKGFGFAPRSPREMSGQSWPGKVLSGKEPL